SAAHRQGFWRRSSTARPATGKESHGTRYAAPQAPPAAACWLRSAACAAAEAVEGQARKLGGAALLQSPAGAREVDVRLPRTRLRGRLRHLRRRLRLDRYQRRPAELLLELRKQWLLALLAAEEGAQPSQKHNRLAEP